MMMGFTDTKINLFKKYEVFLPPHAFVMYLVIVFSTMCSTIRITIHANIMVMKYSGYNTEYKAMMRYQHTNRAAVPGTRTRVTAEMMSLR